MNTDAELADAKAKYVAAAEAYNTATDAADAAEAARIAAHAVFGRAIAAWAYARNGGTP